MHKFGGHCSARHSEVWTCLSQTPPPKGGAGLILLLGEKETEASQGTPRPRGTVRPRWYEGTDGALHPAPALLLSDRGLPSL